MSNAVKNSRHEEATTYRRELKTALSRSSLSRAAIAEALTSATGDRVTERRINAYLAESKEEYRFPVELELPLCEILGDYSLMELRCRRAGFRMIGPEEEKLIEIGRAFLQQAEARKVLRRASK